MSETAPVPLPKSYLLLNHGPTVLVSSAHGARRNLMAASWATPLDFDPPKVLVVVDKGTLTRELIEASGEFALNLPCRAQASATLAAGSCSARELPAGTDKFAALSLPTFAGERTGAPLVSGCVAWLECRILHEPHNQVRYDLFIGEVLAARAATDVFADGRWLDAPPDRRTIHYQAGGRFFATGESFAA